MSQSKKGMLVSTWPMWVLGFVVAIDQADQNVLRGVQDLIKKDFGLSDFSVGLLASSFVLVNALTTVPAGYLADRWNRKRAIGFTIVLWSGFTALGALCGSFIQLFAVRGLLGFGQGISEPSAGSLISDYYPMEMRGRAFSNQQVMFFVGTGLGVALGGSIGDHFGWRWAFVVVGLPGALISLLVFKLREPRRGHADRISLGAAADVEHGEEDRVPLFDHGFKVFFGDMVRGLRQDLKTIAKIPTLKYSMVGVGALLFTVTGVGYWLPSFYERYHHVKLHTATAIVGLVLGAGGIAGTLVGGRIADKYQNRIRGARLAIPAYCLGVAAIVFSISWIPMPLVPDIAIQMIGMFVITLAIPSLRAGLADAVPAHLRGAGFAAFSLVSTVCGAAAAPPILGAIADMFHHSTIVVDGTSFIAGPGLRFAFLICTPPVFLGAMVLLKARNHLDEDVAKIMMAVQQAYMEQVALEEERAQAEAAEHGGEPDAEPKQPAPA